MLVLVTYDVNTTGAGGPNGCGAWRKPARILASACNIRF